LQLDRAGTESLRLRKHARAARQSGQKNSPQHALVGLRRLIAAAQTGEAARRLIILHTERRSVNRFLQLLLASGFWLPAATIPA
jgi:hypothetical protein